MGTFRTIAKLWPTGEELDLGDDSNDVSGPATFTRNAANFVTTDGTTQFQFLFWNTGRHLTRKRRVRWLFSILGWSQWTATRWYGDPEGGPGVPHVRADALRIGTDSIFSDSPIDGSATTPDSAHPFNGDDHLVDTAGSAVTVAAQDPFNGFEFAGWLRLVFGGDPSGEFVETDVGDTPGSSGFGVFEHVTGVGRNFNAAQGSSHQLIAAYGNSASSGPLFKLPKWFEELTRGPVKIIPEGDPAPWDIIRIGLLRDLIRQTDPAEQAGGGGPNLQRLIEAAPNMSAEELQRSLKEIETTVGLANTAKRIIESRLKK